MRYLYYCNSTYQLLNILNLHWHRKNAGFESIPDYKADLFLLNTFQGAEKIAEIVKKQSVFDKVILLEKTFNKGKLHALQTIMDLFLPSLYMKKKHNILREDISNAYDVIVTPKYSMVIDEILQLNKKAGLHLIEDGTASYDLEITLSSNSKRVEKMRKLLGYRDFYEYDRLYLVDTSLYTGINPGRIVEIPRYNKTYLNVIKEQFSVFSQYADDKNIYWLSQFLNNKEFNEMVDEVIQSLLPYKENVMFIQHPRKHLDNKYGYSETDGKQIWELQMLNMKDIENNLFISIHSTASYTAKMLYDLEPYLILFYKLGDRKVTAATEEFDSFLERFKNSYRNPEKVMIPETVEEFRECVKIYLDRTRR